MHARTNTPFALILLIVLYSLPLAAQESDSNTGNWLLKGGLAISAFQQQVKPAIGGESGAPLANDFQLGLMLGGAYRVYGDISLGAFVRLDRGERRSALFAGFDEAGAATVSNQLGGTYTEIWFGPMLHYRWQLLTAELAYALVGSREDHGRPDLPSADGSTAGAFRTSPAVAWLLALGAAVPLSDNLHICFAIEYRVRYYTERGGAAILPTAAEHGTQSIAPLIGLALHL